MAHDKKTYQRNWIARKKEQALANKTCAHCPSNDDLKIISKTKFAFSLSKEKLDAILDNSLILCNSCFQIYDKQRKSTHGHAAKRTSTYHSWQCMLKRCNNITSENYKWYGGRGVTVCERWEKFENFLSDMGERPGGTTLDRINPYGNYEPNNCRWATPEVQGRNKRKNIIDKIGF